MRRLLTLLALLEPVTLAVLLLNVSTLHIRAVAHVVGPVHGICYLGVVVAALLIDGLPPRARLLSLVPAVGGLLVDGQARRGGVRVLILRRVRLLRPEGSGGPPRW